MEIDSFATDLKYLATNGVTLNVEERLNVELAFKTLAKEIPFERLQFWGKIEGKFFNKILDFITYNFFFKNRRFD